MGPSSRQGNMRSYLTVKDTRFLPRVKTDGNFKGNIFIVLEVSTSGRRNGF